MPACLRLWVHLGEDHWAPAGGSSQAWLQAQLPWGRAPSSPPTSLFFVTMPSPSTACCRQFCTAHTLSPQRLSRGFNQALGY